MKIDKTKLIQDIEAMKQKLASMEQELNKPDEFKHFPSKGDTYTFHYPSGHIDSCYAQDNRVRPYTYKTVEEAVEAYDKAVAVERVKRRIIELQGDWKPDWYNSSQCKAFILYDNYDCNFKTEIMYCNQYSFIIPYMKDLKIADTIINEMEKELKVIFDIA